VQVLLRLALHLLLLLLHLSLLHHVQDDHCPADLDALLALAPHLHVHAVLLHQGAELRFVVEDVEASAVELYQRVVAGHGNISDADLAVVASAQLNSGLRDVLDHHDAFCFLAGSLKYHIVSLGLFNGEHLDDPLVLSLDHDWQFGLAHLAFELLEVVVEGAADDFLLDLDVDPLQQALEVDCPARARALAGVEEEVVVLLAFLQADLAGPLLLPLRLVVGGVVANGQLAGVGLLLALRSDCRLAHADLADEELDPAQFNSLAGL
jgi:hypothetical protein